MPLPCRLTNQLLDIGAMHDGTRHADTGTRRRTMSPIWCRYTTTRNRSWAPVTHQLTLSKSATPGLTSAQRDGCPSLNRLSSATTSAVSKVRKKLNRVHNLVRWLVRYPTPSLYSSRSRSWMSWPGSISSSSGSQPPPTGQAAQARHVLVIWSRPPVVSVMTERLDSPGRASTAANPVSPIVPVPIRAVAVPPGADPIPTVTVVGVAKSTPTRRRPGAGCEPPWLHRGPADHRPPGRTRPGRR
jgi:hypothetical protein